MTSNKNKTLLTSSNFLQIIVKALFAFSRTPFMVTIRSGVDPSEIVILAPLFKHKIINIINP